MSKHQSRKFLKELVTHQSFIDATGGALQNHPRMADREIALRFVAFSLFTVNQYAKHGGFDEFLGAVTGKVDNANPKELDPLRTSFIRGMNNCRTVFGEHAFRKWPLRAERKSPINRALFESWGTALAGHDEKAARKAAKDLARRAREMMTSDREIISSISISTGDVMNVRTRLNTVRNIA